MNSYMGGDWILFYAGYTLCGINAAQIAEIMEVNSVSLMKVDSLISPFIISLGGKLPVACLDFGRVLFSEMTSAYNPTDIFILKQPPYVAILSNGILDIVSFNLNEFSPLPSILRKVRFRNFIAGIGVHQSQFFYVLDFKDEGFLTKEETREILTIFANMNLSATMTKPL